MKPSEFIEQEFIEPGHIESCEYLLEIDDGKCDCGFEEAKYMKALAIALEKVVEAAKNHINDGKHIKDCYLKRTLEALNKLENGDG